MSDINEPAMSADFGEIRFAGALHLRRLFALDYLEAS
jgi:hypothetical protein